MNDFIISHFCLLSYCVIIIHVTSLVNCTNILYSGKYSLGDYRFPNRHQFLTPFRGICHHLQTFAGQGRDTENAKELFNLP